MRTFVVILIAIAAALGALAAYSASRAARLGDLHPPAGEFARIDGVRLHYAVAGPQTSPPVLLLHGASTNLADPMLALGERLSKDLRVVAVDRPGHGWSERPAAPDAALPSSQARYIVGLLDKLRIGKVIVVGHSWSGALALTLALDYPDRVAGLVLLAPVAYPWPGGVSWYYTLASLPVFGRVFTDTMVLPVGELVTDTAVDVAFAPQTPPEDYVEKTGARLVLRPAEFRANAHDIVDLHGYVTAQAGRYRDIKVPVLIVAGGADARVSSRLHAGRLAREISGSRLIELSGVGHMVHYAATDTIIDEIEKMAAAAAAPPAETPAPAAPEQGAAPPAGGASAATAAGAPKAGAPAAEVPATGE